MGDPIAPCEGRALFVPRATPSPIVPPQQIEQRVLLLLGSFMAGVGVTVAVVQHASAVTLFTDVTMAALAIAWAARSRAQ